MTGDQKDTPPDILAAVEIVMKGREFVECQRCEALKPALRRACTACGGSGFHIDYVWQEAKRLLDEYYYVRPVATTGPAIGAPQPTSAEEKKQWDTETWSAPRRGGV
jgi:hypothetical protein